MIRPPYTTEVFFIPENSEKRHPLRFWIGLHRDGSGRQCLVDFCGDTMEGVKRAWSEGNEGRLTTMETVIQPKLDARALATLDLYRQMESHLGDSRLPSLENLLKLVAVAAYEAGLQRAALDPQRP